MTDNAFPPSTTSAALLINAADKFSPQIIRTRLAYLDPDPGPKFSTNERKQLAILTFYAIPDRIIVATSSQAHFSHP